MTQITLRPYQQDAVDKIYNSWQAGNRNVCAVLPTGAGKAVCLSYVVHEHLQRGLNSAVIVHRNELVSQLSNTLAMFGVHHKIIANTSTVAQITRQHRKKYGKSFINPTSMTAVIGVDTLIARADSLKSWAQQIDLWINDECFPAFTKITTKNGYKYIKDIKVGDDVLSFDDEKQMFTYRKVNRLYKNPEPNNMVRLTIDKHHVIVCTENHPIYTKKGWKKAVELTKKDEVLYDKMHNMWETSGHESRLQEVSIQENRKSLLFSNMFKNLSSKNKFRNNEQDESEICFRENVEKQSNEKRRNQEKSIRYSQENEIQAENTRWERETFTSSRVKTLGNPTTSWVCKSMYCTNGEQGVWLSNTLQDRCGKSFAENRCRSRWKFTSNIKEKRTRHQERHLFNFKRLENVEVVERRNIEEPSNGFVYNFEVDRTHTYIANDIVVHNCHHNLQANKWGKAVEMFVNAKGLGVTATPQRADGQGLGRFADGWMDDMIIGPTSRWLIDNGFLADYEMVCPQSDMHLDESEVGSTGDWSNVKMRKAAKKSHIVGDVVKNYLKYGDNRKAIVFATDVETADEIATDFNNVGVKAVSLNGKSQTAFREQAIEGFHQGTNRVLVNVDLFDEGFDCGSCDIVIMARPTCSLGKYLQMIGRALRPMEGKTALVIDHVSNVIRHGLPDRPRVWSLDRVNKKAKQEKDPDELELTTCNICSKPYEKFRTACPYCGAEKPLPEPRSRSIEMVDGDLMLLDKTALAEMRAKIELETPESVAGRVTYVAGKVAGLSGAKKQREKIEAQNELKDGIAMWAGYERSRGFNDREIHKRFYLTTGVDVLSALSKDNSRQDYENINERIKGWIR